MSIAAYTAATARKSTLDIDSTEQLAINSALAADCGAGGPGGPSALTAVVAEEAIEERIAARRLVNRQVEFALRYSLSGAE